MNVAFDPWVPVVTTTGEMKLASLIEIFAEGEQLSDLAVRPHERVSLMRLFICVAHAALHGPKNYDEWCDVPKRLPDAVRHYLKKWDSRECFELFHPKKPWLQVAELNALPSDEDDKSKMDDRWSALNKLCLTRASGNRQTLFDHSSIGGRPSECSEEEIVLNLLTFQNYFVAGGKASSMLWGSFQMINPPNPKGGPCSGKSILFTFLRGENLFDSIHLNLSTYDDLKLIYVDLKDRLGKPIWEMPIKSPSDHEAISNATETHIGRLVPQTRILRINRDCKRVLLGSGFLYPKFQDEKNTFYPDSFATIVLNNNGERMLLPAKPNISIWRELHCLSVRRKSHSDSSHGPLCLLNIPVTSSCDIMVNAMITNPKQAAEIVDLIDSVYHIPAQLFGSDGTTIYESEVARSEFWANRLGSALEKYRNEIDGDWENRLDRNKKEQWKLKEQLHSRATTHYWTIVESNLFLLMAHIEAIGTNKAMSTRKAWRDKLFMAAREAYEIACGQETPHQMRAYAKGWQQLAGIQNSDKPASQSTKEDNK